MDYLPQAALHIEQQFSKRLEALSLAAPLFVCSTFGVFDHPSHAGACSPSCSSARVSDRGAIPLPAAWSLLHGPHSSAGQWHAAATAPAHAPLNVSLTH